jgi:SAM-dependent methyltransferase
VALSFGARVVAVDRSLAVEAARDNLGDRPGLDVLQADLLSLPFAPESFDYVYCFGVLQHAPDPRRAFLSLPPLLAAGGRLAVDVYPRLLRNRLWPKYWLRPLTCRLSPATLDRLVNLGFPFLYPVSLALGRVPRAGRLLRYLVPVANYEGVYPLDAGQLREWALLDTLDMLGPRYDNPQTAGALRSWFEEAGLIDVTVFREGFLVGRGRRA